MSIADLDALNDLVVASKIETTIQAILSADGLLEADMGKEITSIRTPAAEVAVVSGHFEKVGPSLRQGHKILITLVVKNMSSSVRGNAARRMEAHRYVLALLLRLADQKFGLPIHPLIPGDWREVTNIRELAEGLMHLELDFETKSDTPFPDMDANAPSLLSVAARYVAADNPTRTLAESDMGAP